MAFLDKHKAIETHATLLMVLSLLVVAIGGIVQIVPLFYLQNTIENVEGMRPYTPLELAGQEHDRENRQQGQREPVVDLEPAALGGEQPAQRGVVHGLYTMVDAFCMQHIERTPYVSRRSFFTRMRHCTQAELPRNFLADH